MSVKLDVKIGYTEVKVNGLSFYTLVDEKQTFLLYHGDAPTEDDMPVLCVDNKCKWRTLYLMLVGGSVVRFTPPIDDVSYRDDKWNPKELLDFCNKNNIFISEDSLEAIVGRWEIEVNNVI